jgi:Cellulose binding domain
MVTPWLAASAGIVIAAALTVDSPAALIYVPNGPAVRCPASGCPGGASSPPGVTTDVPGVQLKTVTAPGAGRPGALGRHRAPYHLGYRVVHRWPWGFAAVITLPADLKPGAWSLRFGFPSARVDHVWGARWQPSGHDQAGTATGSWRPHGHAPDGQEADGRQLTVFAVGTPTLPSGCTLDGVRCEFRR